jgi:putative restriction endonuclease
MTVSWTEAVTQAIRRYVLRSGSQIFSRHAFIESELDAIVADTGSAGATPKQTLSRELQQLRNEGIIEFLGSGRYRWLEEALDLANSDSGKGVFVVGSHSIYDDEPESYYRFPPRWLTAASKTVRNWIIYQEPRRAGQRGYYAAAKVEKIVVDPTNANMYLALIEAGSFLEFGRDVPFQLNGRAVEQGLLDADGRLNNGRAVQSIRPISDADFNLIVGLGLVEEDELLPRVDEVEPFPNAFAEERVPWEGPTNRVTALVNRTVRDRQFRKRVLDAYDRRCAFTGMQLINGGGRAEAQAAHIMSVEAGGPDLITNGIALSGTVHWMFDRGLISLSDEGRILLSHKINDVEGINKLIHRDFNARLPKHSSLRPHPRYLEWHRARFNFN